MPNTLLIALALILIIEGILPFANPASLRKSLDYISGLNDRTLRIVGLVSMLAGLTLLYMVN